MRTQVMEGAVLSGQPPSVAGLLTPRPETGLALADLAAGETTVLLPAEAPAGGPSVGGPGVGGAAGGLGLLGGAGKTTMAAALAQASWDGGLAGLVLWIAVTGRDAVLSGYAQALRELDLVRHSGGSAELIAARFLDWLPRADRPWLIVLDDVADPAAVEGLWPSGAAGRVLVTTRHADAAAEAPRVRPVRVGGYSPREALDYLAGRMDLHPGQRSGALDLASDLGFSALPLGLAGAFMAQTGLDCREYRVQFAERRQPLAQAFGDDVSSAAAAAWSLSVELADQMPPRGLAGRVLTLLCVLTPHGIPGPVLTSEPVRGYLAGRPGVLAEVAEVRAALRNLAAAGLVALNEATPVRTVRIHEMLQAITRYHVPAAEFQRAARAAADGLAQVWSGADVPPAAAQALRDCTSRLHELAGAALWAPQCHPALFSPGHSLDAEGLAGAAAAYWQSMLGTSAHVLGPEHPQTIAVRDLLGSAYRAAGRAEDAVAVYESALRDAERAVGVGHPGSRLACERLTRAYLTAGRGAEAVGLAERFLAGCQQNLGPDHPETLAARANLAGVYQGAGQPEAAIAAWEDVLARRERLLGPRHADTMTARAALVAAYRESGRVKDAINLGKRTLADTEAALGPDHQDTTAARASLASAYRSAKKAKDAHKLYERVLADREHQLGTDHPDTIVARSDLALACLTLRKLGPAITQYERALTDAERVLGHDHAITEALRQSLKQASAFSRSVAGIDLRRGLTEAA